MKKIIALFCMALLVGVVCAPTPASAQASWKEHIEVYNLNVPLGIKVPAGSLVFRADSNFWMIADSAFAKTDSGITMVRRGSTYIRMLYDDNLLKYSLTSDTTSTKLRNGSARLTTKYLWIRVNGTWKKIAWQ